MAATATVQLSSLSAFSALLATALNAMLFSSAGILGFDRSWTWALRSSPVICLFAALDDLALLAQSSTHPARRPERSRRRPDGDAPGEADGPIATLRRNAALRTLSALLALSQTAKVLATTDASWTKAACVTLLLPSAIEHITRVVARHGPPQGPQEIGSKPGSPAEPAQSTAGPSWNSLATPALVASTAALYSLVALAQLGVERALPPSRLTTCIRSILTIVPVGPPVDLAFAVADGICSPRHGTLALAGLFLSNCVFPATSSCVGATAREIATPTAFLAFCPAAALSAYVVRVVCKGRPTGDERARSDLLRRRLTLQIWVVGMHFVAAATCYALLYEPAGSTRPAWTTYLG